MKNKILLLIALVCMLVPFMVLGNIASAEVVAAEIFQPDFLIPSLARGGWAGLWYFNFLSVLSNPAPGGHTYVQVSFTLVEASSNMLVFDTYDNTAFLVSSLSLRLDNVGGTASFTKASDGSSAYFSHAHTDGVIFYIPSSGVNVSYSTNYGSLPSSIVELPQVPQDTFFILNNAYYDGYNYGYDFGLTQGNQDAYDRGYSAGQYDTNNTINTGSASYIKGYQDGLEAPEYSFMSLMGAIIDAPIRAFFGYTEDGVTHPGLFSLNILGYDMSNLVLSIFSLCILITILRMVLGGK